MARRKGVTQKYIGKNEHYYCTYTHTHNKIIQYNIKYIPPVAVNIPIGGVGGGKLASLVEPSSYFLGGMEILYTKTKRHMHENSMDRKKSDLVTLINNGQQPLISAMQKRP